MATKTSANRSTGEQMREVRASLATLQSIDTEIKRRMVAENPTSYGLPDLLRAPPPGETPERRIARENHEMKTFIETKLSVLKDGVQRKVKLTPMMVEFLGDMFFRRHSLAIVWKGRGSGGSFCTSLLLWLSVIYHRMSFTNMAGAQEQAKIIYRYTKDFWANFPDLSAAFLDGEPLLTMTRLKTGAMIQLISASEKQARGKHNPGFVSDESCQDAEGVDRLIMAAMQNAMSEPDHMVVLVSTFHHPVGLFQEIWDYASERGFKRYNWDVFEAMERCDVGLETATADDPTALKFCREQCPLTWQKTQLDVDGKPIGISVKGCHGRARSGHGFLTRHAVLTAQKMNRGTNIFETEYANERPDWMRPVYDVEWIERALVPETFPPEGTRVIQKSAGIDWGLEGQTALVLALLCDVPTGAPPPSAQNAGMPLRPPFDRCVIVVDAHYMTGKLTPEAIKVLWTWAEEYGQEKFYVYGDASHPFNNLEVEQAGFDLRAVPFNRFKDYGIGNVTKFFTTAGRFHIRQDLNGLIEQLKRYRLDRTGKPIKVEDHGPDALMCAMLHYSFEEHFAADLDVPAEPPAPTLRDFAKLLPGFEGVARPTPELPNVPRSSLIQVERPQRKKTSDGQVIVV